MIGIKSFGAHIPRLRLSRNLVSEAWGTAPSRGTVAVANFDEDSLTMACEAASDCLAGFEPEALGGVFFASTTPPYVEKSAATLIATVLDAPREVRTADFATSMRASTTALGAALDAAAAGTTSDILVAAGETRAAEPASGWEQALGDGAGAVLVGAGDGVVAEYLGSYSLADEIYLTWRRAEKDHTLREFNARMAQAEGYVRSMTAGIRSAMEQFGITPESLARAVFSAPDARSHGAVAKAAKLDPAAQVQDALFSQVGGTGTAQPLVMLAAALESGLEPGDLVLLAHYADGVDVMLFRITAALGKLAARRGVRGCLDDSAPMASYATFLRYKDLARMQRPEYSNSTVIMWREQRKLYSLYGSKCSDCGLVRYPPQMVCSRCRTRGDNEEVRLARKGKLFNFMHDYLFESMESPTTLCIVDLDGGGRIYLHMTDRDPDEVELDMEVELTFRKLFEANDYNTYFWKCRPARKEG